LDETNHFFNLGYGWLCKHCSAAQADERRAHSGSASTHDSHGEPEAHRSGHLALASWTDATRQTLCCRQCGIEELIHRA